MVSVGLLAGRNKHISREAGPACHRVLLDLKVRGSGFWRRLGGHVALELGADGGFLNTLWTGFL